MYFETIENSISKNSNHSSSNEEENKDVYFNIIQKNKKIQILKYSNLDANENCFFSLSDKNNLDNKEVPKSYFINPNLINSENISIENNQEMLLKSEIVKGEFSREENFFQNSNKHEIKSNIVKNNILIKNQKKILHTNTDSYYENIENRKIINTDNILKLDEINKNFLHNKRKICFEDIIHTKNNNNNSIYNTINKINMISPSEITLAKKGINSYMYLKNNSFFDKKFSNNTTIVNNPIIGDSGQDLIFFDLKNNYDNTDKNFKMTFKKSGLLNNSNSLRKQESNSPITEILDNLKIKEKNKYLKNNKEYEKMICEDINNYGKEDAYNFIKEIKSKNSKNNLNNTKNINLGGSRLSNIKKTNLAKDLDNDYFISNDDPAKFRDKNNLTLIEDERNSESIKFIDNPNYNEDGLLHFILNKNNYFYNDENSIQSNRSCYLKCNNSIKNINIDEEINNIIRKESTKVKIMFDNNFDFNFDNLDLNKDFNEMSIPPIIKINRSIKFDLIEKMNIISIKNYDKKDKIFDINSTHIDESINNIKHNIKKKKFFSPNVNGFTSNCIPNDFKNNFDKKGEKDKINIFSKNIIRLKNYNDLFE